MGRRRLRPGPPTRPSRLPVHRLLGLPLVPRDGPRVVRGRRRRRRAQRRFREHQGRPRGTPRRRRRLHGGGPGRHRLGRLADERLPHPRRSPLLRRHLLPARTTDTGMPSFRTVLAALSDAWDQPPPGGRSPGRRAGRRPWPPAPRSSARRSTAGRGRRRSRAAGPRCHGGRGARPQLRPPVGRLRPGARSSPSPPWSTLLCATRATATDADRRHPGPTDGRRSPSTPWPPAASTTTSAVASPATRPTTSWLVPHFEKMLYDQAGLLRAFLHGWQVTGRDDLPAGWSRGSSPTWTAT